MSKTIETLYPKTLLLENVVSTRAEVDSPVSMQKAASGLSHFIRTSGARPTGPLIQVTVVGDGPDADRETDSEFLRQASTPITGDGSKYAYTARISLPGCVLARFHGQALDFHIVFNKLAVFAYEHDLELSGKFFAVFVNEDGTTLTADVFASTISGA